MVAETAPQACKAAARVCNAGESSSQLAAWVMCCSSIGPFAGSCHERRGLHERLVPAQAPSS